MRDLSNKIGTALQPVFDNKKFEQHLKPKEIQPRNRKSTLRCLSTHNTRDEMQKWNT